MMSQITRDNRMTVLVLGNIGPSLTVIRSLGKGGVPRRSRLGGDDAPG